MYQQKNLDELGKQKRYTLSGEKNEEQNEGKRIKTQDEVEIRENARLHFDKYENDMWEIRRRVVERFRGLCGMIVARNRADDRIQKIQRLIGDVLSVNTRRVIGLAGNRIIWHSSPSEWTSGSLGPSRALQLL